MRAYLTVWRLPSAPVLLISGFAGRLPSAMVPLALLLMVQQQTGSYAVAGLSSATLGIAMAVMAPLLGRFADRRGPRIVLFAEAALYPVMLAVLATVVLNGAPAAAVIGASAAAGATTPLVSGTVRALWSRVDPAVRPTAYALDATATELVFVAGPTTVAALTVLASPAIALGVAGVLAVAGAVGIATSAAMRAWVPVDGPRTGLLSTVAAPGMPRVLLSGSALMLGFGALEVAIPAFADAEGRPELAGVLIAVWSVSSLAGGLAYGAMPRRSPLARVHLQVALLLPLSFLPVALAFSPATMALLVIPAGMFIAPLLATRNELVGWVAPKGARTEAYTWPVTAFVGGIAVGSAVAGVIVEAASWRWAFVAAGVVAMIGTAVAVARRGTIASPAPV